MKNWGLPVQEKDSNRIFNSPGKMIVFYVFRKDIDSI